MATFRRDTKNLDGTVTTDQVAVPDEVVNLDATLGQLEQDAGRLAAARARSLEIRDGWATMSAAQRDRAVKDLADNSATNSRVLLHLLRMVRQDFSAPPEA